jgi:uncharacterized protein
MTRSEAYSILTTHLHNKNLIKHCLATEAAMLALYEHLIPEKEQNPEDKEKWGITGLLHDADYEVAQKEGKLDQHGSLLFDELEKDTIPKDIEIAIRSHNFTNTGVDPVTAMDWAITCCDQLTGLIVACALIHPEKKLEPLTVEFVQKRFGEKAFAKGADRKMIAYCEEKLQIPLPEFIDITLNAMKKIHKDLGL